MTHDHLLVAHVCALTFAVHQVSMVKLLVHYVVEVLTLLHLVVHFRSEDLQVRLLLHVFGGLRVEIERIVQLV